MTLQYLLTQNVERILRKHRIQKQRDFQKLPNPITDRKVFVPLQKRVARLSFVRRVDLDFCSHSVSSSYLGVRFCGRKSGGVSIHLSHHFQIFYATYVPPEGYGTVISWKMTREQMLEQIKLFKMAQRRKIPAKEKGFMEQLIDEIVASGWLFVPDSELKRRPRPLSRIPIAMRPGSLGYYFFDSIDLF